MRLKEKITIHAPRVLKDLARSGLTNADACLLRIEGNQRSYRIPYFELDGQVNGFYRDRFVGFSTKRDRDGRTIRYSQPPKEPPRLYLPPLNVDWGQVAVDACIEVLITEGEKKSACACKHGFPTIGLGGVWNWRSKGEPIPDLDCITWEQRRVAIVFDSDAARNGDVRRAERDLADELRKRGALVRVVRLPADSHSKVGLDDLIVKHGAEAFRSLLTKPLGDGVSFADLAAADFPAVKWIIRGLIPVGLTLLAGKSKIGKSWMAVAMSVAVAKGLEALGRYECDSGDVLHLALEDTPRRFKSRMDMVLRGADAPKRAEVHFQWPRVEQGGLDQLRDWLASHPSARLIQIDTLAKMRPRADKGDSNAYLTDYDDIGALKRIADDFNVGIVVIHHQRKMEAADPVDEVSGTTGLTGAADTILVLKRARKEDTGTLFVTGRDVAEQELALQFDAERGTWTVIGKAEEVHITEARQEILKTLAKIARPAKPHEVAELIGKKRDAVRQTMRRMYYDGDLTQEGDGIYTIKEKKEEVTESPSHGVTPVTESPEGVTPVTGDNRKPFGSQLRFKRD